MEKKKRKCGSEFVSLDAESLAKHNKALRIAQIISQSKLQEGEQDRQDRKQSQAEEARFLAEDKAGEGAAPPVKRLYVMKDAGVKCACACGELLDGLQGLHQCVRCDLFVRIGYTCFAQCEGRENILGNCGVCLACGRFQGSNT